MTDFASLVIEVDSRPVTAGTAELDKLAPSADRAERAVETFGKTTAEAGKQTRTATQAMRDMTQSQTGSVAAAAKVTNSAASQKAGMQQLSYQLNDMAAMFGSGSNAMQIFSTQAGQTIQAVQLMTGGTSRLAGFLAGPWGAAITAATIILVPLISNLWDTADAADGAKKALEGLRAEREQEAQRTRMLGDAQAEYNRLKGEEAKLVADIARASGGRTNADGTAMFAYRQSKELAQVRKDMRAMSDDTSFQVGKMVGTFEDVNAALHKTETATTRAARATSQSARGMSEAEKATKAAAQAYDQAFDASKSYIESLQREVDEFGKSAKEIREMEVARRMAAAATDEQRAAILRLAGVRENQIGTKELTDGLKWRNDSIAVIEKEIKLLGLVGAARDLASLALEKEGFMAEAVKNHVIDANAAWEEYRDKQTQLINGKSFLEQEAENAAILLDRVNALSGAMTNLGGPLGKIFGVLTDRDPTAALLNMGGIGTLIGLGTSGGQDAYKKQRAAIEDGLVSVFGQKAEGFAKTLSGALQGAGIGGQIGSILGGSKAAQFGAMAGGALGQVIGEKVLTKALGKLGDFAGPIGAIAGSLLGGVLGGLLNKNRSAGATLTGANSMSVGGKDKGNYGQATDLGKAVQDGLGKIADSFGAEIGSFLVAIGMRGDQVRVNTNGSSLKFEEGAQGFGKDAEAAVMFAIANAIEDGALKGLSAGIQKLLTTGGDLEAQLQKALNFQAVFDELASITDPGGVAVKSLDAWKKSMDATFAEAGATAEELAKLEELYGKKRADIADKYAQEALEKERDRRALEIQIMELSGDASGALAAARALELEQVDAALKPLYERIYALQDEAAATALANEAAAKAASELAGYRALEIEFMDASGRKAEAEAARRADTLAGMDSYSQALQKLIWKANDATAASELLAQAQAEAARAAEDAAAKMKAIADERYGLETQLLQVLGDTATIRARELALLDPSNRAMQQYIWALEDQKTAQQALIDQRNSEIDGINDTISALSGASEKWSDMAKEIREFRAGIFEGTAGSGSTFATAQAEFQRVSKLATMGNGASLESFTGVSQTYLNAAKENAGSLVDYRRALGLVAAASDAAAKAADDRAVNASAEIIAMYAQRDELVGLRDQAQANLETLATVADVQTTAIAPSLEQMVAQMKADAKAAAEATQDQRSAEAQNAGRLASIESLLEGVIRNNKLMVSSDDTINVNVANTAESPALVDQVP